MRLLIAEKPHLARVLKENNLITPDTEIVFTFGIGLWRFTLPKLSHQNIPFTETPSELRPQSFRPRQLLLTKDGNTLFSVPENSGQVQHASILDAMVQYLRERMPLYEEVICAVDPDRTGYGAAHQLLGLICNKHTPPVHCLYLYSLEANALTSAWKARKTNLWNNDSIAQTLANKQQAKATFDYWWNSNSSLVLSELCKWTNLTANPLISKYELMAISLIAENPRIPEGELLKLMSNWTGSGKYSYAGEIGSPASRVAILESAINRGILEITTSINSPKRTYSLTLKGESFMNRLHRKTFDPDLPFRLEDWIAAGDFSAMRRYINTVFGRQLRYQRNQLKCSITQSIIHELFRQCGMHCFLLRTEEDDSPVDRLLLRSSDCLNRGEMAIRAYSGGPFAVTYVNDSANIECVVQANGDDELHCLSVSQWVTKVGHL